MKITLSLFALVLTFGLFSQTGIIANRSHSATLTSEASLDSDNFGLFEPSSYVREVEYLGSCCVVIRTEWEYNNEITLDTLCDDPFMQQLNYDPKLIKEYYPDDVKLIGFEKYKKEARNSDQNGFDPNLIWFFVIVAAGFVAFLFFPNLSRLKK
jgi:hypothetical protein